MTQARPGRWKPGESGNPKGRAKGSGATGKLRAAIADDLPAIIAALTERARAGDPAAAKLLLDRVLPALKAEAAPVAVPGMAHGSLTERAEAALRAVADGEVAPDTGASLVGAVAAVARVVEVTDLQARIEKLEAGREGD